MTEAKSLPAVAREKCWDQLPEMFGLPGWEELEHRLTMLLFAMFLVRFSFVDPF
jgi:hypothetical protein